LFGVVIFDEGLLAHLVDLLQRVHLFLQLENSIFQHLDIELILALPPRLTHDVDAHLRPITFPYLPRPPMALALVVLLDVLRVVMLGPLEDSRMVASSGRLNFI
jgi:hypothetical protein